MRKHGRRPAAASLEIVALETTRSRSRSFEVRARSKPSSCSTIDIRPESKVASGPRVVSNWLPRHSQNGNGSPKRQWAVKADPTFALAYLPFSKTIYGQMYDLRVT
jgi:hypothetical protein